MKKVFVCLYAIFVLQIAFAQDTNKVIVNPVNQNEQNLKDKMYKYPQFLVGQAIFRNGTVTEAKLNYSYMSNTILFIDPKGDTLELSQAENFSAIVIAADTFRYYKKDFIQQLTNYASCNLYLRRYLKFNGTEKKGAYGTYSRTTSSTSYTNVTPTEGGGYLTLTPDELRSYIFYDDYFFTKENGEVYPATKKGINDLFSKNQKALKAFLEQNPINFNKREDLDKVLAFALSVFK